MHKCALLVRVMSPLPQNRRYAHAHTQYGRVLPGLHILTYGQIISCYFFFLILWVFGGNWDTALDCKFRFNHALFLSFHYNICVMKWTGRCSWGTITRTHLPLPQGLWQKVSHLVNAEDLFFCGHFVKSKKPPKKSTLLFKECMSNWWKIQKWKR